MIHQCFPHQNFPVCSICVYVYMCVFVCVHVCTCVLEVFAFTVEQRLEPVPLKDFSDHVKNMHKDRDLRFEEEYAVCSYNIYIYIYILYKHCKIFTNLHFLKTHCMSYSSYY